MKVTLHFKSGLVKEYARIGSICTIQRGKIMNLRAEQLACSMLAYDDTAVNAVVIEMEEEELNGT